MREVVRDGGGGISSRCNHAGEEQLDQHNLMRIRRCVLPHRPAQGLLDVRFVPLREPRLPWASHGWEGGAWTRSCGCATSASELALGRGCCLLAAMWAPLLACSMSEKALRTRIWRIQRVDKLRSFIQVGPLQAACCFELQPHCSDLLHTSCVCLAARCNNADVPSPGGDAGAISGFGSCIASSRSLRIWRLLGCSAQQPESSTLEPCVTSKKHSQHGCVT